MTQAFRLTNFVSKGKGLRERTYACLRGLAAWTAWTGLFCVTMKHERETPATTNTVKQTFQNYFTIKFHMQLM